MYSNITAIIVEIFKYKQRPYLQSYNRIYKQRPYFPIGNIIEYIEAVFTDVKYNPNYRCRIC